MPSSVPLLQPASVLSVLSSHLVLLHHPPLPFFYFTLSHNTLCSVLFSPSHLSPIPPSLPPSLCATDLSLQVFVPERTQPSAQCSSSSALHLSVSAPPVASIPTYLWIHLNASVSPHDPHTRHRTLWLTKIYDFLSLLYLLVMCIFQ